MVKIKGIFKGIKYLTQIFVVKEHEMEIGYPTDVRHVAHIGFESSSVNAPTWMREFKTTSGFSSTSLSDFGGQSRETSWASFDFDQFGQPPGIFTEGYRRPESAAKTPKKTKRKTSKASSSPSSSTTRSSSRSSKSAASSFATAVEEEARQTTIH